MSRQRELQRTNAGELLRVARDALVIAGRHDNRAQLSREAYWTVGSLRQVVVALDPVIAGVARDLVRRTEAGELTVVEGPFAGDSVEAALTGRWWLDRARANLRTVTADAIDNAHVAVGGLAVP
ncbi:hypothetical protein [Prauserella cavernicola]|uniref:Uncharacterized protein n=1 Tax=Prauserella cavernicola TaxID=2800127 RepID=A0A934R0I1_9PSEU|nr:hypothetical protein [Prauserella cavernicola]MBK1789452.1 hypothetical protein [Prauserella cavernicola]